MDEIIYRCPDFSEYLLARGATGDFSIDRLSYECQRWWYCFIVVGLFVWLTGCMTVCLGAFLYVCLSVCVSAIVLSVCMYVCLCMYICLNVRPIVPFCLSPCLCQSVSVSPSSVWLAGTLLKTGQRIFIIFPYKRNIISIIEWTVSPVATLCHAAS